MVVPEWCSQSQECQARGVEKRAFPAEKMAKARPGAEEKLPVLGMASAQRWTGGAAVKLAQWLHAPSEQERLPKVVLVGGSLS